MLICNPEWCNRQLTKVHIDFLSSVGASRRIAKSGEAVFLRRTEISMMNSDLVVSIVDDDESVRESLPDLLKEFGFASETFSSAEEFLASEGIARTQCLILDVAMPGMRGPELQGELNRRKIKIPVIFVTGQRDETLMSRLIEQGAIACLIKPFTEAAMLQALTSAFQVK
jgi:FixJ family two-component response regulator